MMDDLISRQAVIDRAVPFNLFGKEVMFVAVSQIEDIPAAQLGTNLAEVGTDCISRQAAIEAVQNRHMMLSKEKVLLINDLEKLPSVQPEPIRINLNEPIKVKLTDWGKEIYYHQYDRANQITGREICKPEFPKEDENGYTEFQLWRFMELYGEHMGMTLPNVIEPLEIVYER